MQKPQVVKAVQPKPNAFKEKPPKNGCLIMDPPKAKKTTSQPKIARKAPPCGKPKTMGGRNKPAVMPEVGPFLCLPPSLGISQGQEPELKDQGNQDQARIQNPESPRASKS